MLQKKTKKRTAAAQRSDAIRLIVDRITAFPEAQPNLKSIQYVSARTSFRGFGSWKPFVVHADKIRTPETSGRVHIVAAFVLSLYILIS